MINVMAWFQKSAGEREKEQRKAEIAQDTIERITRAVSVPRPHPTDIRSILEVHRKKVKMAEQTATIPGV